MSTLNSTRPPLTSLTARSMSNVIVPALGFGIRPRRPRILPSLPTRPIESGVASATSNSSQPASIFLTRSSPPTSSAPARSASWAFSPWANTATRTTLPVPCGQDDRAADHLVGVARDRRPSRRCASIGRVEADGRGLLDELGRLERRVEACLGRRASPPRGTSCRVPCAAFLPVGPAARPPPSRGVGVPAVDAAGRDRGRPVSRRPRCPCCGRCPRSGASAASTSLALRSAILIAAISRTWSLVTRPTVSRLAVRRPSRRRPPCAAGPRRAGS